jgi:hypothetical protein
MGPASGLWWSHDRTEKAYFVPAFCAYVGPTPEPDFGLTSTELARSP